MSIPAWSGNAKITRKQVKARGLDYQDDGYCRVGFCSLHTRHQPVAFRDQITTTRENRTLEDPQRNMVVQNLADTLSSTFSSPPLWGQSWLCIPLWFANSRRRSRNLP